MLASIVIPYTEEHKSIVSRAIQSAHNQTVPVNVIVGQDYNKRGAGWIRNRLFELVKTPFVVFLDADDVIEPSFVQEVIDLYQKHPDHYIYTSWHEHLSNGTSRVTEAPEKAWCAGTWHCISSLIPSAWFQALGGFDESLPALEDTDFFLKLITRNGCGVRLNKPLFHYHANDNGRSRTFYRSGQLEQLKIRLMEKYNVSTPCCGGKAVESPPVGEKLVGDVLATVIPSGRMTRLGKVSGRNYPYSGPGDYVWVDPRDVAFEPHVWRTVEATGELPKVKVNDFNYSVSPNPEMSVASTPFASGSQDSARFALDRLQAAAAARSANSQVMRSLNITDNEPPDTSEVVPVETKIKANNIAKKLGRKKTDNV